MDHKEIIEFLLEKHKKCLQEQDKEIGLKNIQNEEKIIAKLSDILGEPIKKETVKRKNGIVEWLGITFCWVNNSLIAYPYNFHTFVSQIIVKTKCDLAKAVNWQKMAENSKKQYDEFWQKEEQILKLKCEYKEDHPIRYFFYGYPKNFA